VLASESKRKDSHSTNNHRLLERRRTALGKTWYEVLHGQWLPSETQCVIDDQRSHHQRA
jgi:hypothetical protein